MQVAANGGTGFNASLKFREQDVGTTGSVFTFALAPIDMVAKDEHEEAPLLIGFTRATTSGKDVPVACVLAQLAATGQLQAVSSSSLQAYVTGVLSGQGQAIQVINAASTANIAGTTFYVGYGPNAAAMLASGLNRSVATVTGTRECVPQAPQTGWWWNPVEGGRGYSIETQGNHIFFAAFTSAPEQTIPSSPASIASRVSRSTCAWGSAAKPIDSRSLPSRLVSSLAFASAETRSARLAAA